MKLSFLTEIVTKRANQLKEDARYSGSYSDGGCGSLLKRLQDYRQKFVVKLDLRPSEFKNLNDIEVGEPEEFSEVIEKYKIQLAKNIKL
ncbi:hypothetical protein [Flavobacterium sp. 83]|uniref:hypothetical protein n=1 Tax=Flavobacterium sp. 83 TaxID=1131812 RepID=UPI0005542DF8|nr:hypothetical protein [Flavobacterium sp. 83]